MQSLARFVRLTDSLSHFCVTEISYAKHTLHKSKRIFPLNGTHIWHMGNIILFAPAPHVTKHKSTRCSSFDSIKISIRATHTLHITHTPQTYYNPRTLIRTNTIIFLSPSSLQPFCFMTVNTVERPLPFPLVRRLILFACFRRD